MSLILGKRVPFFLENVSSLEKRVFFKSFSLEKGYFVVLQISFFFKKGVFFSSVNIRNFACEWPDRDRNRHKKTKLYRLNLFSS